MLIILSREELGNLSQGSYDMNFFSVEHHVGIDLSDDFILTGRNIHDTPYRRNFTVSPMKKPHEYDDVTSKRVAVHDIAPLIYVAHVQFDRPFGYSTSTWTNKGNTVSANKEDQCDKKVR